MNSWISVVDVGTNLVNGCLLTDQPDEGKVHKILTINLACCKNVAGGALWEEMSSPFALFNPILDSVHMREMPLLA